MQVFTGLTSTEFCESYYRESKFSQTSWVQFGQDALLIANESDWQQIIQETGRRATPFKQNSNPSQKENLYLVIQKGRLFQKEHPDVPVLMDKGRFLVVELDSQQAQQWDKGDEPCYAIRPLQDYPVVFQLRSPSATRLRASTEIQNLVNQISQLSLQQTLQKLVSFPTRYSTSQFYTEAATWVKEQLDLLGYETRIDEITVRGEKSLNVIAQKQGKGTDNRELVILTAHLDSINHDDEPLGISPGADDNGSGSAGVIEIAKVLKNYEHQHDLCLVLFGGEEQGLFGSQQYVRDLTQAERSRIKAVINMDMIGSLNTATPTVMLEGARLSQAVIDGLAYSAEIYTGLTVQTSLNPFASDHVPFINAGLPAVLTIEGADSANNAIHSANDTLTLLNDQLMLEILRMNVAFMASLLNESAI
ncbi:M28 family metallopeptidase [Chroococcus sp. FPU101]|uniref:M28 family metallopeptidase n=1 Tax=Chroococcus sp. FPU101 TaxID=1974212 RepID=UPI001A8D690E|nr:M28 family metallopeptidase [Chroococcus sp. FPU101]GFE71908.1 hypothetical protein CFPU101_45180 [Chroococcus sp. FPU101]